MSIRLTWAAAVLFAVVSLVFTVSLAAEEAAAPNSDVLTLTKENFDDVIKEKIVFVKFFAPWCSHCKAMEDDFKSVASEMKGKAILADLDATVEEDIAKRYDVEGFPSLKMFSDGQLLADYNGGRDKQSIIKFLQRAQLPTYVQVNDKKEYDSFVKKHADKSLLVAVAPEKGSDTLNSFKKATYSVRDIMPDSVEFVLSTTTDVIEGAVAGDVYLLKFIAEGTDHKPMKYNPNAKFDDGVSIDDDDDDKDNEDDDMEPETDENDSDVEDEPMTIDTFVKRAALPIFQEFTTENAEVYTELPAPVILGFFNDCEDPQCKMIEEVAKSVADHNKAAFAWVNKESLHTFVEYVGLQGKKIMICAYDFRSDSRYFLPKKDDFVLTTESLRKWVNDVIAGNIPSERRSETVPKSQDGPLHIVVGDTWESDVAEVADHDVFIAQIANWDEKSAALKPIMRLLNEKFKAAGTNHVRFAIMDATENEAPDEYKAEDFPTIHYFPIGSKRPSLYTGAVQGKDILKWIKEKSSKPISVQESSLGPDPSPDQVEEMEEMDFDVDSTEVKDDELPEGADVENVDDNEDENDDFDDSQLDDESDEDLGDDVETAGYEGGDSGEEKEEL